MIRDGQGVSPTLASVGWISPSPPTGSGKSGSSMYFPTRRCHCDLFYVGFKIYFSVYISLGDILPLYCTSEEEASFAGEQLASNKMDHEERNPV